jgi:hypothetical protein
LRSIRTRIRRFSPPLPKINQTQSKRVYFRSARLAQQVGEHQPRMCGPIARQACVTRSLPRQKLSQSFNQEMP